MDGFTRCGVSIFSRGRDIEEVLAHDRSIAPASARITQQIACFAFQHPRMLLPGLAVQAQDYLRLWAIV